MPYVAPGLAVKWLSKMLTLIMADMAVSGPKLATFVKRLTCKWSAPLCIKPSRWERSPQRRQYICQCDRLASFCWGRRVPPPACCQTISQSVKLASLSLRMRTNANVNVVTSCPAIRSGDRVIHPSIACTVQVQWKIVCVARIWWTIKTPSIKASVANSRPHPIYALPFSGDQWSQIGDRWSLIADRGLDLCTLCLSGCPMAGHLQIQITSLPTVTFDNALGYLRIPQFRDLAISLTALRINWPQADLATCLGSQSASRSQLPPAPSPDLQPRPAFPCLSCLVCVAIPSNCLRHTSLACCHMRREKEKFGDKGRSSMAHSKNLVFC